MNSIMTVTYRRLRSFGSYENEAVEATAVVDGRDPADVLNELKSWVDDKLGETDRTREYLDSQKAIWGDLDRDIKNLNEELNVLTKRRDRAVELLKKHGVDTTELEEIPF